MSRAPRKPSLPRLKVGAVVGLPDDLGCVREALVIEDRGDIGPNGEQSVWLSYHIEDADGDFDGDFRTVALASELVDPPTESWADQFWSRVVLPYRAEMRKERRKARRSATA
jgi:hypothetical protein